MGPFRTFNAAPRMSALGRRTDAGEQSVNSPLWANRRHRRSEVLCKQVLTGGRAMNDETWWEGPLCVTHPINGRRIVGMCEGGEWRWAVYINGPTWQDQRMSILFPAGRTVEVARKLAFELGPKRDRDEQGSASELLRQIEGHPSLLEQFLAYECTPNVKELLTSAIAEPSASQLRFEFNRFEVSVEPEGDSVLIVDVLDPSQAGEQRVTTQQFLQDLSRCRAT